jgi:hypothetical protein
MYKFCITTKSVLFGLFEWVYEVEGWDIKVEDGRLVIITRYTEPGDPIFIEFNQWERFEMEEIEEK